ncbi:MAG: hypothetical protein C0485_03090 [Pirellula sp.]|nr:hypothetical protein [Pirellula sp.]
MLLPRRHHWVPDYLAALGIVAACTVLGGVSHWWELTEANVVMIFMAGVALTAAKFGHGPALAAIALSVASYSFFFVPPVFAFAMIDSQYVITLGVMVAIGWLISELTSRLRAELKATQLQERRTAQLYLMTRELGQLSGTTPLVNAAGSIVADTFDGEATLFLQDSSENLRLAYGGGNAMGQDSALALQAAAATSLNGRENEASGETTETFVAMQGVLRTIGVLGVRPREQGRFLEAEERRMLETYANLIALSLERDQSMAEAHQAQMQVETEQLRNSLFTSISHDLRSPLATISVTTQGLLDEAGDRRLSEVGEALETIVDEARQLGRQVDNLLDMGRLNSGALAPECEWHVLEELVGVALSRLRRELAGHEVRIKIPEDFPLLWAAGDLIVQVLANLLSNAVRYTPPGSRIAIWGVQESDCRKIVIADDGPGIPAGREEAIFEKFVRGSTKVADGRRGMGLGLAICRGMVTAHGGTIRARNRPEGGAEFVISLPCRAGAPPIRLEEEAAHHRY